MRGFASGCDRQSNCGVGFGNSRMIGENGQTRIKRKYTKRKIETVKRNLPPLDPFAAAKEADAHAQEGNRKLCMAVDALRSGLETIVRAEVDNLTGLPTTTVDLRKLAVEALEAYSAITGQNWRRSKLTG